MTEKCRVCDSGAELAFKAKVLDNYDCSFLLCPVCGLLQAKNPFWLAEAYASPINADDTGVVERNLKARDLISSLIALCFDRNARFLDYGGGNGLFTRMMRDVGFDYYWSDPHCQNIFARGFEDTPGSHYELVSAIEVVEHAEKPLEFIKHLLEKSDNIVISTELHDPVPREKLQSWYYLGLRHGQHISIFSARTFEWISKTLGLHCSTSGRGLTVISKSPPSTLQKIVLSSGDKRASLFFVLTRLAMRSRTREDCEKLSVRK